MYKLYTVCVCVNMRAWGRNWELIFSNMQATTAFQSEPAVLCLQVIHATVMKWCSFTPTSDKEHHCFVCVCVCFHACCLNKPPGSCLFSVYFCRLETCTHNCIRAYRYAEALGEQTFTNVRKLKQKYTYCILRCKCWFCERHLVMEQRQGRAWLCFDECEVDADECSSKANSVRQISLSTPAPPPPENQYLHIPIETCSD